VLFHTRFIALFLYVLYLLYKWYRSAFCRHGHKTFRASVFLTPFGGTSQPRREISGSQGGEYKDGRLLSRCAVQTGKRLPTFQRRLLPPSPGRPGCTTQQCSHLYNHFISTCFLGSLDNVRCSSRSSSHFWTKVTKRSCFWKKHVISEPEVGGTT
jgi:hypothetical protein